MARRRRRHTPIVWTSSPGHLYILQSASLPGLVKVGLSVHPERRLGQLKRACGLRDLRIVYQTDLMDGARMVETVVHRRLQRRRVGGLGHGFTREWYRCDVERAVRRIDATVRDMLE